MERLYLPPSLRYFEPMRIIPREPMEHASFVYDLVAALGPRLVVDVGTGAGVWLSVVCQSLRDHDIDGVTYGIDPWEDEDAKDEHDPTRWSALNAFLRSHFRGVYYLLKMPCADGLQHFADGSVDLLRLGAARAGAPLAALVDAWLPRLAPGGVLLCPGVNDSERSDLAADFQSVAANGDAFLFSHGKGLGVLRRPNAGSGQPEAELLALLASFDSSEREGLARFYEHADRHHALRAEVHERWSDLPRRK